MISPLCVRTSSGWIHGLAPANVVGRFFLIAGLMAISIIVAPGSLIGVPVGPLPAANGTGLPTSVWTFPSFVGTLSSGFDAAMGTNPPTATFLTNTVNYPLSTPISLQAFVGSSGSGFSGTILNTVNRSYFVLTGYIALTANGANSIPFRLRSDDGSQLFLGGVDIINNDGVHTSTTLSGTADFTQSGLYPIVIKYFNNLGTGELRMTYDPNNSGTFVDIPTALLYASAVPEPATWATGLAALLALASISRRRTSGSPDGEGEHQTPNQRAN